MTTIDAPRSSHTPAAPGRKVNWEKWGWLYMRASGILLVVLIFGHLFVNLFLGTGVRAIDFAFVGLPPEITRRIPIAGVLPER